MLSDLYYFEGQRTENKLMVILPVSVKKLLQICFSVLCRCVPLYKCNIIYCKCNTAWVSSLYNTSSLNMETTYFEVQLSMVLYLTRSQCISFEKYKMKYAANL